MKRLLTLISMVLIFASCVKELDAGEGCPGVPEGAKVTVSFSIAGEPEDVTGTKAVMLGEDATLSDLYIAVFGSSGYLKEYVHAYDLERKSERPDTTYIDREGLEQTVPLYHFKADFTITEGWRTLHFIGNGPTTLSFGYEEAVMTSLLSENGARAYWQTKTIHGIKARKSESEDDYTDQNGRKVSKGDFIDNDGNKVVNGIGYVPDAATAKAFRGIALVRNWAKITIETAPDSYFTPKSYAVVNVPSRGAIAPHCAATGFVKDYKEYSFQQLLDKGYTANLPMGTTFDNTVPPASAFENPNYAVNGVTAVTATDPGAVYMYERPMPTDKVLPTAIIMYGRYDNPNDPSHSGQDYYYKVDLMEDDIYYPIFRNFRYQIKITKILSMGHHTPAAAAAAAGSADVSADINASHLADISDGMARLILSPSLSHTYTEGQTNNTLIQAFFVDNVDTWNVNMDPSAVTVERRPMPEGADNVITTCEIGPPEGEIAGSIGWRTIKFSTVGQEATTQSQTMRVTATYTDSDNVTHHLYRDVVITLMPTQTMKLRFLKRFIPAVKNSPLVMDIVIPDGLPESMFPLDFWIEPEDMTLTPDVFVVDNNLPVSSGPSINKKFSDNTPKPAFHFTRTLSLEDYKALPTERDNDNNTSRVLTCKFRSNVNESATTIWVRCEHFNDASARFTNSDELTFLNVAYTSPIKRIEGTKVQASFNVPELEGYTYPRDYPQITLFCSGMELTSADGSPAIGSHGQYTVIPTSSSISLEFLTTTDSGEVQFELEAADYETVRLSSHTFRNFGFVDGRKMWKNTSSWSDIVCGRANAEKNKFILFGYEDDPDAPNAEINITDFSSGLQFINPSYYPWTPDGPRAANGVQTYHEIELKTQVSPNYIYTPISFTLSAPGYIEEEVSVNRFMGSVYRITNISYNTALAPENTYGFDAEHPSFTATLNSGKATEHSVTFTFSSISELRNATDPKGLLLAAGGTYTLTVTNNSSAAGYYPFYIQFNVNSGKWENVSRLMGPDMTVSGTTDGSFSLYRDSNNQFIWNLPAGTTTATLTLKANEDYPISIRDIYLGTYKAELY